MAELSTFETSQLVSAPITEPRLENPWLRRGVAIVAAVGLLATMSCTGEGVGDGDHGRQPSRSQRPDPQGISCRGSFAEIEKDNHTLELGVSAKGEGGVKVKTVMFSYGDGTGSLEAPLKKEAFGNYGVSRKHTYHRSGTFTLGAVIHGTTKGGSPIKKNCIGQLNKEITIKPWVARI